MFASLSDASVSLFGTDGSGLMTGPITYASGDMNASATPSLFGIAVDPMFFETYVLDEALDVFGRIIDPSFGEVFTVGSLGIDVTSVGGMAIDADGNVFAALSTDGFTTGLYSINTASGAATSLGAFSGGGVVSLAAVPEPSVSVLAGLAGLPDGTPPSPLRLIFNPNLTTIIKMKYSTLLAAGLATTGLNAGVLTSEASYFAPSVNADFSFQPLLTVGDLMPLTGATPPGSNTASPAFRMPWESIATGSPASVSSTSPTNFQTA